MELFIAISVLTVWVVILIYLDLPADTSEDYLSRQEYRDLFKHKGDK